MKIILDLRTFFVGPQHVVLRRDRFLNVHLGLRCTRFCFAFFLGGFDISTEMVHKPVNHLKIDEKPW